MENVPNSREGRKGKDVKGRGGRQRTGREDRERGEREGGLDLDICPDPPLPHPRVPSYATA